MSNTAITLLFDAAKYGWSETYFKQGTISDADPLVVPLAQARLKLCGIGVNLTAVRLSQDDVRGDSRLRQLNYVTAIDAGPGAGFGDDQPNPGGGGGAGRQQVFPAVQTPSDFPFVAALVRSESTPLYRRMTYLRGNPDTVTRFNDPVLSAAWLLALRELRDYLIVSKMGFMVIDRSPGSNPIREIDSMIVEDNAGGKRVIAVTTSNAHGFKLGEFVRISGLKLPKALNGTHQVIALDGVNTFVIDGTGLPLGRVLIDGKPVVLHRRDRLAEFTGMEWQRFVSRKTGRPFDSPRGRRSRRK